MIFEFRLEQFIPLLTSDINSIILKTKEEVNLFISQNGTGKTSILKELHPFPPDTGKFKDGGVKFIGLLYNSSIYELTSVIGKDGYNSFKVNGVEKNTGTTATAQRLLVEQHFGYTQSMMRISTGLYATDLFNCMSPSRRKEYLMWLYPNDTSYAMSAYDKLKDEYYTLRGALKSQISRYAIEKKVLDDFAAQSETKLLHQIDILEKEISEGFQLTGQLETFNNDQNLNLVHEGLLSDLGKIMRYSFVSHYSDTIEGVKLGIQKNTRLLDHVLRTQNESAKRLAEYNEELSLQDGSINPDELKSQLKIVTKELEKHTKEEINLVAILNDHPTITGFVDEHSTVFMGLGGDLVEYLTTLVISSVPTMTASVYNDLLKKQDASSNAIKTLERLIEEKKHKLKHWLGMEDVKCPDCDGIFKIGVTKEEIEKLKKSISGHELELIQETRLYNKHTEQVELDAEWFTTMRSLNSFIRQQPGVLNLQLLITEYDLGKVAAVSLVNAINAGLKLIKTRQHMLALSEEQSLLTGRLERLNEDYIGILRSKIAKEDYKLWESNRLIKLYRRDLRNLDSDLHQMESYESSLNSIRKRLGEFKYLLSRTADHQLKINVDSGISERVKQKNKVMGDILKSRSMYSVVESIDEDIKRIRRRLKVVKILMDGLCPNKGLIGRLMLDFIKAFCGNVNAEIKECTTIPLLLKPCNKDNGDLTYKFPVKNGNSTESSDVADCSAGESEIINFTVRKVGMRYKPQWLPLFMDEVGVYLDEINRGKFFEYIQRVIQSKEHAQLFMVSHYVAQHGMFDNPNIVALKAEGLTMTGIPNTNTTIL